MDRIWNWEVINKQDEKQERGFFSWLNNTLLLLEQDFLRAREALILK